MSSCACTLYANTASVSKNMGLQQPMSQLKLPIFPKKSVDSAVTQKENVE